LHTFYKWQSNSRLLMLMHETQCCNCFALFLCLPISKETYNKDTTDPQATKFPDGAYAHAITHVVGIVTACSLFVVNASHIIILPSWNIIIIIIIIIITTTIIPTVCHWMYFLEWQNWLDEKSMTAKNVKVKVHLSLSMSWKLIGMGGLAPWIPNLGTRCRFFYSVNHLRLTMKGLTEVCALQYLPCQRSFNFNTSAQRQPTGQKTVTYLPVAACFK